MINFEYRKHPRHNDEHKVLRHNYDNVKTKNNNVLLKYIEKLNKNERMPNNQGRRPTKGGNGYRTLKQNNVNGRLTTNSVGMVKYFFITKLFNLNKNTNKKET